MPDHQKPKVFVGSSSEKKARDVAEAVREHLNRSESCEVTVWTDGIFAMGQGNLETLKRSLDTFDFAVMVFSPDDAISSGE